MMYFIGISKLSKSWPIKQSVWAKYAKLSNSIPSKWHEIIVEQTIAEAILDRIVHDAHRIEIKGDSLRKKKQPKSEEDIESIILKN